MSANLRLERVLWTREVEFVAGVDEAGRGCLAGPVVAGAVILDRDVELEGVTDSKAMTAEARASALEKIKDAAVAIGLGLCTPAEIDRMNILWATMEAMRRALSSLPVEPSFVLVDGNRFIPTTPWPFRTVIKGDARSQSIGAASIVAKVTRDRFMECLHEQFSDYGWDQHKGYATAAHYEAIRRSGLSPHHRRSFDLGIRRHEQIELAL